jgi:hypothetical protein
MNKFTLAIPIAFLLTLGQAQAQVSLHIDIGLPPVPKLVVVSPGITVVEGSPEEVFFSGGFYWCRRPDGWYRSRRPGDHFAWIDARRVPPAFAHEPVGRYRNWHHQDMRPAERREAPRGHDRRADERHDRHEHEHEREHERHDR